MATLQVALAVAFLLCVLPQGDGFKCASKGSKNPEDQLQIHMVPHTHDDVGWLKTVDQYYYGSNNSIAHAGVQYILDSVVAQLVSDPNKTFIYVEMAFFKRWWDEQSDAMKATVKKLVKDRQLEFINGGWCMNDEAATHYNAIIDQMTYGLKFIRDTFGDDARPRIAWQIDPFGHSSEQASIFAQMSFEGLFFGRIDYQDKEVRRQQQRLELIWRGSRNLGKASEIFTGTLYNLYNPPPGFCFDGTCHDPPIQDDPRMFDLNVEERVATFIKETCEQAEHYKSGHIMLTMGSDFNYENANLFYKNMDKLIKYVNKDGRVNAFYSSPSLYVDAVQKSGATFETKTDDFFPYADCPHCYWTGYFTSRPTFKGYVRKNNNLLQTCKQLEFMHGEFKSSPTSDTLRRAMAVNQHHDAVSGTAKQHVTNDYYLRLAIGEAECQDLVGKVINSFSAKTSSAPTIDYSFCNFLNISACPLTENSKSFTVTLYNPLIRDVRSPVMVPVALNKAMVKDHNGEPFLSQIIPVSKQTNDIRMKFGSAKYSLLFNAKIPALGYASYFVELSPARLNKLPKTKTIYLANQSIRKKINADSDVVIDNGFLKLVFSSSTGRLTQMMNLQTKQTVNVDQQFFWYNSSTGTPDAKQESGAYIFRPNGTKPFNVASGKIELQVFTGYVVEEVRQVFSPYVSQVVRLYSGQPYAEFEYSVGPIPIKDGLGKEVISRFDTDIKSGDLFYTDANGREMQERKVNYRPSWKLNITEPVAGNYYPINSRMYIKDSDKQLTVLTDRSLGGSSLKSGSLEIMVHRRTLEDDYRGVNEPLNETAYGRGLIVRGKFFVLLNTPKDSGYYHRTLGEQALLRPELAFAPNTIGVQEWINKYKTYVSGVTQQIKDNVHLLTLETMDDKLLIRVEHMFEEGEDAAMSEPVSFSLKGLFTKFEITSLQELNLSANQVLADKKMKKWNTEEQNEEEAQPNAEIGEDLVVTLKPMQIRTFKATFERL